jgi:CheY-like chemotaxis protein
MEDSSRVVDYPRAVGDRLVLSEENVKVLFLDDWIQRLEWAQAHYGKDTVLVGTAQEAIAALSNNTTWDVVSLDHDLNHEAFVDSSRADSGMEVVRWIVANKPIIRKIFIHTGNHRAAPVMINMLTKAGYTVVWAYSGESDVSTPDSIGKTDEERYANLCHFYGITANPA